MTPVSNPPTSSGLCLTQLTISSDLPLVPSNTLLAPENTSRIILLLDTQQTRVVTTPEDLGVVRLVGIRFIDIGARVRPGEIVKFLSQDSGQVV